MKINNLTLRYFAAFALLTSLLWGFWWLTWVLAIVSLFIFTSYYEIIILGIAYDALYGLPIPQFYNFPYIFTLSSIILFLFAQFLRGKLIAYTT